MRPGSYPPWHNRREQERWCEYRYAELKKDGIVGTADYERWVTDRNRQVALEAGKWPSEEPCGNTFEQHAGMEKVALHVASMLVALLQPSKFPDAKVGAETLAQQFRLWVNAASRAWMGDAADGLLVGEEEEEEEEPLVLDE